MLRVALALAFAFAWFGVDAAHAQRRLALVIGVAEYRDLPAIVRSPTDARAVKGSLTALGFKGVRMAKLLISAVSAGGAQVMRADGGRKRQIRN